MQGEHLALKAYLESEGGTELRIFKTISICPMAPPGVTPRVTLATPILCFVCTFPPLLPPGPALQKQFFLFEGR